MFDQSEFKAFADDNLNVAKMKPFVSDGLENIVGKAVYFRVIETRGYVVKGFGICIIYADRLGLKILKCFKLGFEIVIPLIE